MKISQVYIDGVILTDLREVKVIINDYEVSEKTKFLLGTNDLTDSSISVLSDDNGFACRRRKPPHPGGGPANGIILKGAIIQDNGGKGIIMRGVTEEEISSTVTVNGKTISSVSLTIKGIAIKGKINAIFSL
jgi:hypothetical protein